MSICILLTASIDPGNTPEVMRASIRDRELDYLNTISKVSHLGWPVVFCENSGYKSEAIEAACERAGIEFLQFKSSKSHMGKGHGEWEIIDHAFIHSALLDKCEYVLKLTGRIYVRNLPAIIRDLPTSDFLICSNFVRNLTWTDSRCFIFNKEFYKKYFGPSLESYLNERSGVFMEHCLARACHMAQGAGKKWIPLPAYPYYQGINASNNQQYQASVFKRWKYQLYYTLKLFVLKQTI